MALVTHTHAPCPSCSLPLPYGAMPGRQCKLIMFKCAASLMGFYSPPVKGAPQDSSLFSKNSLHGQASQAWATCFIGAGPSGIRQLELFVLS